MNKKRIKIVTVGGGSSYTPELAEGFIKRIKSGLLDIKEWWLVDINEGDGPSKLEIITNLVKRMFEAEGLNTKIYSTLNRREALAGGADFVTTQLRVGRLAARAKDERIPLSHGFIGQETNGAGGLFKALRTIPVILDIVKDVKELADGAWIINFTNPAGIVTQAIAKYGNYEKFLGVCNVPINTKINVAKFLKMPVKKIKYNVAGLNHFVFFSRFWVDDQEVTPQILDMAKDAEKFQKFNPANATEATFEPNLIEHFQAMPCAYHQYYFNKGTKLKNMLKDFDGNTTRAEMVIALEKTLFKKYQDPNLKVKPQELEQRGGAYYSEVACAVIEAIHNDTGQEMVVSTVNDGHIVNMPNGITVEATSIITSKGAKPLPKARDLKVPTHALSIVMHMKNFELMVAKAGATKNSKLALMALQMNPLSEDSWIAKKVFNELIEAHSDYLAGFETIK